MAVLTYKNKSLKHKLSQGPCTYSWPRICLDQQKSKVLSTEIVVKDTNDVLNGFSPALMDRQTSRTLQLLARHYVRLSDSL
jgi:hypothetical protein